MRILNHITWKKITQFEHPVTINNTKAVSIFQLSWLCHKELKFQSLIVCCVSRLCTRKWKVRQLLVVMTCRYTTSQLAPPCSIPRANVCQLLPSFEVEKSQTTIWLILLRSNSSFVTSLFCFCFLIQMRSVHCRFKCLWSNQIQIVPTPRSVSLLWHSAQIVAT